MKGTKTGPSGQGERGSGGEEGDGWKEVGREEQELDGGEYDLVLRALYERARNFSHV